MKYKLVMSLVLLLIFGIGGWQVYSIFTQDKTTDQKNISCKCCQKEKFHETLRLSDEQKIKIAGFDKSFNETNRKTCEILCERRKELAQLIETSDMNNPKIEMCLNEVSTLQLDLEKNVIKHLYDVKSVLNEDQQKKFVNLIHKELK